VLSSAPGPQTSNWSWFRVRPLLRINQLSLKFPNAPLALLMASLPRPQLILQPGDFVM
jgi:hypothetical protein